MSDALRPVAWSLLGAFCALFFLHGVLEPPGPRGAVFAATFLSLVAATCVAPFTGLRGAAALAGAAAVVVLASSGSLWTAKLACAGYLALYAATAAAMGRTVWRPAVVAAGLLLLTTFWYWDEAFLFDAEDRSASAALAFALNPAAAASQTIGFDWMHAKALYSKSQTAESIFTVPVPGLPTMAWKTALLCLPFGGIAWWRR